MLPSISQLLPKITKQKIQLDTLRPFDQTQLKNLRERFRIGFIHHSNAIEGNTLTLQEVKMVIEEGITIGGKTLIELQETINHGKLMDQIHDMFEQNGFHFTPKEICQLHKFLTEGIVKTKESGHRRTISIRVSGSEDSFPLPQDLTSLMDNYCKKRTRKKYSLEQIAHIHYDFVKIHPFVDGNGRIARVLMNLALVSGGYFPIIISKSVRKKYIESLQGNNFDQRYQCFLWQLHENNKDYLRFLSNNN